MNVDLGRIRFGGIIMRDTPHKLQGKLNEKTPDLPGFFERFSCHFLRVLKRSIRQGIYSQVVLQCQRNSKLTVILVLEELHSCCNLSPSL